MTPFQLRRLAFQATRRPELLPVLQDALLESPVYGAAFEWAMQRARDSAAEQWRAAPDTADAWRLAVVFDPRGGQPPLPDAAFYIYTLRNTDFDWANPGSWVRVLARTGRSIVFVATPAAPKPKRRARRSRA